MQGEFQETRGEGALRGGSEHPGPPGDVRPRRGLAEALWHGPGLGASKQPEKEDCFRAPPPPHFGRQDGESTPARSEEFGVRVFLAAARVGEGHPWGNGRPRAGKAVPAQGAHQGGVDGYLRSVPKRKAVGDHFKPAAVEGVSVQVEVAEEDVFRDAPASLQILAAIFSKGNPTGRTIAPRIS